MWGYSLRSLQASEVPSEHLRRGHAFLCHRDYRRMTRLQNRMALMLQSRPDGGLLAGCLYQRLGFGRRTAHSKCRRGRATIRGRSSPLGRIPPGVSPRTREANDESVHHIGEKCCRSDFRRLISPLICASEWTPTAFAGRSS